MTDDADLADAVDDTELATHSDLTDRPDAHDGPPVGRSRWRRSRFPVVWWCSMTTVLLALQHLSNRVLRQPGYELGRWQGLHQYLDGGGRVMYLGGNGFYWVTGVDPERPHIIEIRRWRGTETWETEPGEVFLSTTGERSVWLNTRSTKSGPGRCSRLLEIVLDSYESRLLASGPRIAAMSVVMG